VALLAIAPMAISLLHAYGRVTDAHQRELFDRWKSWLVLTPLMLGPILLGAFWTMLGVALLGICCYRECSRAAGIEREWSINAVVIAGMFGLMFAGVVQSYALFASLSILACAMIPGLAVLADRPRGYLHRVSVGVFGFVLFGIGLGHLSLFTFDRDYRAVLFLLVACVQLNDIFAYICGKLFGRKKLAPNTSPNKTIGGAVGAVVLSTLLAMLLGHFTFRHSPLDSLVHLATMGAMIGTLGVIGDLVISSIKRDLGIKDMGSTFPGHGGWLDRFNSLLLASPALFYYVAHFRGVEMAPGTFTGG